MFETLKSQIKNGRFARDIDLEIDTGEIHCTDTEYEVCCPDCDNYFNIDIDVGELTLDYDESNSEDLLLAIYDCFGIKDGETPEEFRKRIIDEEFDLMYKEVDKEIERMDKEDEN